MSSKMDLLKLLIDSGKGGKSLNTCFLCFESDIKNIDVNTVFEIHNDYFEISLSLADMIKSLFPLQDFLFRGSCNNCSDLISKLYVLIQNRKFKTMSVAFLVKQLGRDINEFIRRSENNDKVIFKIQVPTFKASKDDLISPIELSLVHDNYKNNELYDKSYEKTEIDQRQNALNQIIKTCPHCPESFQHADQYKSHLKIHKKKRQRARTYYYCNDCNYKTLCKTTLQGHINKNHLHTRPHTCLVCYKGFYNKSNLTEHTKTHSKQRNEVCEVCGCSFIHKKNLIEHLRLHSDTRPYECKICSKRFVTSGRRSDHIKRSHMERSQCCLICNKKYSLKKELTRHVNSVHLGAI